MDNPIFNDDELTAFIDGSSVLVVIVTYKSGELTINALEALTSELSAQPDMRAIIVDNTCGYDAKIIETAIIENDWSDWVKVAVSPRNGGFSFGNNIAIRAAIKAKKTPEYIWLLNPDTYIYPDAGSSLVKFLDANAEVGIAGSCLFNADGTEWGVAFRFPTIFSEIEQALQFGPFSRLVKNYIVAQKMGDEPSQVDWLPGASMMIRFDVFSKAGFFDEDYFLYYEETDFCLNATLADWTSWYVPSSKVMHIAGQSTGVTGESASLKRLPQYMFDSRCLYFIKNHGFLYAMLADIAKIGALICNKLLILLRGKSNKHNPYLLRDSFLNFTIFKLIKRFFQK